MSTRYEPPEVKTTLTSEEIHKRYQDMALVIFKEEQQKKKVENYLSFGNSRRTMEYSNFGNDPVIVHRSAGFVQRNRQQLLTWQIFKVYRNIQSIFDTHN